LRSLVSSGLQRGIHAEVIGTGAASYFGVYSRGETQANGRAYALYGQASGNGLGDKIGLYAYAQGTQGKKYGIRTTAASSGGPNYGIYAEASGGTYNYSGYFNTGDVFVRDNLGIGIKAVHSFFRNSFAI
jgi:hypothetical protein